MEVCRKRTNARETAGKRRNARIALASNWLCASCAFTVLQSLEEPIYAPIARECTPFLLSSTFGGVRPFSGLMNQAKDAPEIDTSQHPEVLRTDYVLRWQAIGLGARTASPPGASKIGSSQQTSAQTGLILYRACRPKSCSWRLNCYPASADLVNIVRPRSPPVEPLRKLRTPIFV